MKRTFCIIFLASLISLNAFSDDSIPPWIFGNWKFIGFFYQNQFKAPLNPNLNIIFHFESDGTDYLYWNRTGEPGFCERKGHFSISGTNYNDEVLWTNPHNAIDCSQDPDMQVGKKTSTEIELIDGKIRLNLGLGDEPFYYIFEPIDTYPNSYAKQKNSISP